MEPAVTRSKAWRDQQKLAKPNKADDPSELPSSELDPKDGYMLLPAAGVFWDESTIQKCLRSLKRSRTQLVCSPDEFDTKREFKEYPLVRDYFVQYHYKKPQHVFVVTNAYGVLVNDTENFHNRTAVTATRALAPNHRPVLILPTVKHWWHENSKDIMRKLADNFVEDLKAISTSQAFINANNKFGILPQIAISEFGNKMLRKVVYKHGGVRPATFPVRISTDTDTSPNRITIPIARTKPTGLTDAVWDSVMVPSFLHCGLVLVITGFKITQHGYSLDLHVDSLIYAKQAAAKPHEGLRLPEELFSTELEQNNHA